MQPGLATLDHPNSLLSTDYKEPVVEEQFDLRVWCRNKTIICLGKHHIWSRIVGKKHLTKARDRVEKTKTTKSLIITT